MKPCITMRQLILPLLLVCSFWKLILSNGASQQVLVMDNPYSDLETMESNYVENLIIE